MNARSRVAITLYLVGAISFQLMSAWLLMPTTNDRRTGNPWSNYAARVGVCIGGSFVAAFAIACVVMALLDAGVI